MEGGKWGEGELEPLSERRLKMETWHFKHYRFARRAGGEQSAALCASVPILKERWKRAYSHMGDISSPTFF